MQSNLDPLALTTEQHGLLVGLLCINPRLKVEEWLALAFEENGATPEADVDYAGLLAATRQVLAQDLEFEFDLNLPSDDEPLSERAAALAAWCRGFLNGMANLSATLNLTEEGREVLADFYRLTDLDTEVDGEEDEAAYAELSEYVRVGVQLLYVELQPRTPSQRVH